MASAFNILLMFLGLCTVATAQSACIEVYRRYSAQHTGCLPANSSCDVLARGVTQQEKQDILKLHNDHRSTVANGLERRAGGLPTAANMLEMVWDDELARVAQKLSDSCRYGHDCQPCRQVDRFLVGQNIGRENGMAPTKNYADWKWMIDLFYNEVQHFRKNKIKPFVLSPSDKRIQYGHFSQIAWATTWRVGCGWTLYQEPIPGYQVKNKRSYFACNYGPRGNFEADEMYKVGPTCSDCPENTCCGQDCANRGQIATYPGLCKVLNENLPPEGDSHVVQNALFYCGFMNNDPDCSNVRIGSSEWGIITSNGDNYGTTVVNGGQSLTVTFSKTFRSTTGRICFSMLMRRSPERAGDPDNSRFVMNFITNGRKGRDMEMRQMSAQRRLMFNKYEFVPRVSANSDLQFSFTFIVPPGARPQFLDVKRIYMLDGSCPR